MPLRWTEDSGLPELTGYLLRLAAHLDVTVVDGSPDGVFAAHARVWAGAVRHIAPEEWPGRNGKVAGVMTGVRHARHDAIVLGDDDVRHTPATLRRLLALLDGGDVVVPQNFFRPTPWHARWDTARSLVNRAFGSDYPGTLAVRRSTLLHAGGYDGDVLFENLELIRTVEAVGGRVIRADNLFVERRPPTTRHFLGQRVRQAYDSFAQPARLVAELALAPVLVWAARRPARLLGIAATAIGVAEFGRRRRGGRQVFAPTAALWAPAWVLERAVCAWLAVGARLRGGARYTGGRIPRAGSSPRALRARGGHRVP